MKTSNFNYLKRKRRQFKINLFKLFTSIIIIIIVLMFFNSVKSETISYNNTKIIVNKGDNLWNISIKYKDPQEDIRSYVYKIKKLNNINDIIQPGDVLLLP